MKKLTDKEEAFCQAYVNDADPNVRWNKTQSAIKAGYSEKTAREIGYENLTKLHIQERVEELSEKLVVKNKSLTKRVVEEFEDIGFNKDGKITERDRLTALQSLAKYLGMDKIDITSKGEALPATIIINGVKSQESE